MLLLFIILKMANKNPMRALLYAFLMRVGMTGVILIVDVPAMEIEPIGGIWDIASVIFLLYFWFTFFRKAGHVISGPRPTLVAAPGALVQALQTFQRILPRPGRRDALARDRNCRHVHGTGSSINKIRKN